MELLQLDSGMSLEFESHFEGEGERMMITKLDKSRDEQVLASISHDMCVRFYLKQDAIDIIREKQNSK